MKLTTTTTIIIINNIYLPLQGTEDYFSDLRSYEIHNNKNNNYRGTFGQKTLV